MTLLEVYAIILLALTGTILAQAWEEVVIFTSTITNTHYVCHCETQAIPATQSVSKIPGIWSGPKESSLNVPEFQWLPWTTQADRSNDHLAASSTASGSTFSCVTSSKSLNSSSSATYVGQNTLTSTVIASLSSTTSQAFVGGLLISSSFTITTDTMSASIILASKSTSTQSTVSIPLAASATTFSSTSTRTSNITSTTFSTVSTTATTSTSSSQSMSTSSVVALARFASTNSYTTSAGTSTSTTNMPITSSTLTTSTTRSSTTITSASTTNGSPVNQMRDGSFENVPSTSLYVPGASYYAWNSSSPFSQFESNSNNPVTTPFGDKFIVLSGTANNSGAIAQVIQLANGVRQTLQYYYRVSAYNGINWSCDFTSIYNTDQSQVISTVTLNSTQLGPDFRSQTASFYPAGNGVGQLFFLLLCENSPNNYSLDVVLDNFSVVAG